MESNTDERKVVLKDGDTLIPIKKSPNISTTRNIIRLLGDLTKNNIPWYILSCGGNRNDYINLIEMDNSYGININASGEIWLGYEGENQELYRVPGVKGVGLCDQIRPSNDKIKGLTKLMEVYPFLTTVEKCLVDDQADNITALNSYLGYSIRPGEGETTKYIFGYPNVSATFFVHYGSNEEYVSKNILNNYTKKIDQIYRWFGLVPPAQPQGQLPAAQRVIEPAQLPGSAQLPGAAQPQNATKAVFFDLDETLICIGTSLHVHDKPLKSPYIFIEGHSTYDIITSNYIIDLLHECSKKDNNTDWYIISRGNNIDKLQLLIGEGAKRGKNINPNGTVFALEDRLIKLMQLIIL